MRLTFVASQECISWSSQVGHSQEHVLTESSGSKAIEKVVNCLDSGVHCHKVQWGRSPGLNLVHLDKAPEAN